MIFDKTNLIDSDLNLLIALADIARNGNRCGHRKFENDFTKLAAKLDKQQIKSLVHYVVVQSDYDTNVMTLLRYKLAEPKIVKPRKLPGEPKIPKPYKCLITGKPTVLSESQQHRIIELIEQYPTSIDKLILNRYLKLHDDIVTRKAIGVVMKRFKGKDNDK